jgi:peptidoglycan lytic transglycosylase G
MLRIKQRHKKPLRIITILFVLGMLISAYYVNRIYQRAFKPNINLPEGESFVLFLPHNTTLGGLKDSLFSNGLILDTTSFNWMAGYKNMEGQIRPGRYVLKPKMSNRELCNKIMAGYQDPFMLLINKKRLKTDLTHYIGSKFEFPADSLLQLLNDQTYCQSLGFDTQSIMAMFVQDSYEFIWTITAKDFMQRMKKEFDKYWNKERIQKITKNGLNPVEAMILASIVDEETARNEEKPIIAGLYINRLKKHWKLQADPTIKFAVGDFTLNRILFEHLEIESPYNTYKYEGLPPGPICIPYKSSIEAVVNAEKHDYMFMCAKEDFSGYHNFAKTHRQHEANRRKYIRALNNSR